MSTDTGKIISTERVTPDKHLTRSIDRLYSPEVHARTLLDKITYLSDSLRVTGYLARPINPGRYPVLIWNRGGNGDDGALTDLTAFLILASTALWGYVVLATQYRGNMGSDGTEDWGGGDVDDALALIQTARTLPFAYSDRMAVEGASRGGMTAYRMLAKHDQFRCAIVHAGLTDLVALANEQERFARFVVNELGTMTDEKRKRALERRSAIHLVDRLPQSTPVLLLHGDADRTVPPSQSEKMAAALKAHNIPHEYHPIARGGHIAIKDSSYLEIDALRKEWLERHLT